MWRERRWRDRVSCDEVTQELAGAAHDPSELGRRRRRHTEHCLRCQAELAQHRKLLRALYGLRTSVVEPPPGFAVEAIARLHDEPEPEMARSFLSGRRVAYAGGLAAATAGAAVSAVVLTARSRRTRLAG